MRHWGQWCMCQKQPLTFMTLRREGTRGRECPAIAGVQAVTVPEPMHQTPNDHLRRRVLGLHGRHDAGTLGFADPVGHEQREFVNQSVHPAAGRN